jgi:hypothetical protein
MKYLLTTLFAMSTVIFGFSQPLVNWEWKVDSTISYYDLDYVDGFIYGVGRSGLNGIIAKKDTNGGTSWMNSFPGIVFAQLCVSEQHEVFGIGVFQNSIVVNGNTYISYGGSDVIAVRCDSMGNTTLVKQFGSLGDDSPIDICVDHHGAFYIAAYCSQSVTQSANTFAGNLISKFNSQGVGVFLHELKSGVGPITCWINALKYSRADSTVVLAANYQIILPPPYNNTLGSVIYNTGSVVGTVQQSCQFDCGNIILGRIPISGNSVQIWGETYSASQDYYTTDATVQDSAVIRYNFRYEFSLNGYASNQWGGGYLSSNGHWGPNDQCGSDYIGGEPRKLDIDSVYNYGTIFQPELECYNYNCSEYFLARSQNNSTGQDYWALDFPPGGLTGYNGSAYVGNLNGGLYKLCTGTCPSIYPLTIVPLADITMCPGDIKSLQLPACFKVYGGEAPYTYSWSPTTGLNDPTIFNPTVSGLTPGIHSYTLTVTDQNATVVTDTVVVNVITPPSVTATLTPALPVCGDSLLIVAGGAPTISFFWVTNQNTVQYVYNDSLQFVPSYNTTFRIIGMDSNGCADTLYQPLNLQSSIDTTVANICYTQPPPVWNGLNITASGYYTATFTNIYGCDSIKKLVATVYPLDIVQDSITICDSQLPYTWNGMQLTAAGTYTDTTVGLFPPMGCDSINIFKLKVEQPNISSVLATPAVICSSDTSTLSIQTVNNSGGYCNPTSSSYISCLTSFQFNTINNSPVPPNCGPYANYSLQTNVIAGSSYPLNVTGILGYNTLKMWVDWNQDSDFNNSNELVFNVAITTPTVSGSILVPTSAFNGTTRLRVCASFGNTSTPCSHNSYAVYEDYVVNIIGGVNQISWSPSNGLNTTFGNTVKASPTNTTTYTITVNANAGCVIDTTLTLVVLPNDTTMLSDNVCSNLLPYSWYGMNLNASGNYYYPLVNSNGCDSMLNLQLTVLPTDSSNSILTLCPDQLPYTWNGISLTAAGSYYYTTSNTSGCDSTAGLNLLLYPQPNPTILWNGISLYTSTPFASYQWYWNGNLLVGATNSSWNPTQNGNYTVMVTDSNGCTALSNIYTYIGVSVGSIAQNNFTIVPNPANNQTQITFGKPFTGKIELFNPVGQIVYLDNVELAENKVIALDHLSTGNYILRMSTMEWTEAVKITISR